MKEEKSWRHKLFSLSRKATRGSSVQIPFSKVCSFFFPGWETSSSWKGPMVLLNHNYWSQLWEAETNDEEERHRFIVILKVVFFWRPWGVVVDLDFTSVSTESDLYSHRFQCYLLPFQYQFGTFLLVPLPHISREDSTPQGIQEIDTIAWAWCIFQRVKV